MLERPSNSKSAVVKRALAALFAPLAKRCGQSFSIVTSLINSVLCKHEHSVVPIAELMQQFVEDHDLSHLASDALREVGSSVPSFTHPRFLRLPFHQARWAVTSRKT